MSSGHKWRAPASCVMVVLIITSASCSSSPQDQSARDEKTRDEVAKATERAKPVIEDAGRKIGEAAHQAADEARAAAQGVRDGWNSSQHPLVDLNSATQRQLLDLPGITKPEAHEIIAGRPYREKHELVTKGILSETEYLKIRDHVAVK